jgi:hypothetical protein
VKDAGYDSTTTTLSELFDAAPTLEANGAELALVSCHTQWVGGERTSLLLLHELAPACTLTPAELRGEAGLAGALRGQLIVTPAAVPPALLLAMLRAGARGVVCPRLVGGASASGDDALGAGAAELAGFFESFYLVVLRGGRVQDGLARAEQGRPSLRGRLALHVLQGGAVVAHPPAPRA